MKQRLLALGISLGLLLAGTAQAADDPPATTGFLSSRFNFEPHERISRLHVAGLEHRFTPKLGLHGLVAFQHPPWTEAYAGPSWRPNEHLTLQLAVGGEVVASTVFPRFAVLSFGKHGHFDWNGDLEWNSRTFQGDPQDLWYDLTVHCLALRSLRLRAGLELHRSPGFGPRLTWTVPVKTAIDLGLAWTPVALEPNRQPPPATFLLNAGVSF